VFIRDSYKGMSLVQQHSVPAFDTARLTDHVGEARAKAFTACLQRAAAILRGRRLVNVTGDDQRKGGVYEIMRSTLPYLRGAGIDIVWVDLRTQSAARPALEFFHVLAHGWAPSPDWRDDLPSRALEFAKFCRAAGAELKSFLRSSDVVLLHDTQCAPIPGELDAWRGRIIWHAHIGTPDRNELVDNYWRVAGPGVSAARACVFYRPEYAPLELRGQSVFAAPGVDPSSPKNALLSRDAACAVLADMPPGWPLRWVPGAGPVTGPNRVIAVQLSRWDALKDMPGALRVFARIAELNPLFTGMVVGPSAQSAAERLQLKLCVDEHRVASLSARSRVHIGVIEQCGTDEHDQVVRVLQSAADIVLQKSVQEGFGLTVTEAMLRGKPVLASAVGGIPLQLRHGRNGMLLPPGSDDEAWAARLQALVSDAELRLRLGARARTDVLDRHTVDREVSTVINQVSKLMTAAR
jgi:trehalose synthase